MQSDDDQDKRQGKSSMRMYKWHRKKREGTCIDAEWMKRLYKAKMLGWYQDDKTKKKKKKIETMLRLEKCFSCHDSSLTNCSSVDLANQKVSTGRAHCPLVDERGERLVSVTVVSPLVAMFCCADCCQFTNRKALSLSIPWICRDPVIVGLGSWRTSSSVSSTEKLVWPSLDGDVCARM